jgi:sulfonate transport system substrate-binding protein
MEFIRLRSSQSRRFPTEEWDAPDEKGKTMISRRQTLGLLGAAAATAVLPAIKPARAAATEFRIGWQKNGVLALAKRRGALEKRLADKGITVSWS